MIILKRTVLITLSIFVVLIAAVLIIGLWHGNGTIFDFLAGQVEPEPRNLDQTISLNGANGATYAVTVVVNPSKPIGQVSPN